MKITSGTWRLRLLAAIVLTLAVQQIACAQMVPNFISTWNQAFSKPKVFRPGTDEVWPTRDANLRIMTLSKNTMTVSNIPGVVNVHFVSAWAGLTSTPDKDVLAFTPDQLDVRLDLSYDKTAKLSYRCGDPGGIVWESDRTQFFVNCPPTMILLIPLPPHIKTQDIEAYFKSGIATKAIAPMVEIYNQKVPNSIPPWKLSIAFQPSDIVPFEILR